jgi:hypothetical protein
MDNRMKKPLPCPCCGNANLHVGVTSAMSQGVECWPYGGGCGLSMRVGYPNTSKLTMKECEARTLAKAVSAWNKRATNAKKDR